MIGEKILESSASFFSPVSIWLRSLCAVHLKLWAYGNTKIGAHSGIGMVMIVATVSRRVNMMGDNTTPKIRPEPFKP
jgi:hypothetical protein